MGFGSSAKPCLLLLLPLLALTLLCSMAMAQSFNCSSPSSCRSLVGYVTVNNTDLGTIRTLFNVKNLRSLLGANNLPLSTPRTHNVSAQQEIKIPINCVCYNNTGTSNGAPIYTVKPGDGLFHIAAEIFSRLVTFPQIAEANGVTDPNLITVGQELKIPLPCSCDDVNGQKVVHYAHMVKSNTTLVEIARQFGTDEETLARINGITKESDLKADQPIDVPLKACNSSVRSDSHDYPLLVANDMYAYTANGCVRCTCDAANNGALQCEPSQNKPSKWDTCPSMLCEGSQGLSLGNSTTSGCNRTTCSYAGYNSSTIFTSLVQDDNCSTASSPSNDVSRISLNLKFVFILVLLCFHLFR